MKKQIFLILTFLILILPLHSAITGYWWLNGTNQPVADEMQGGRVAYLMGGANWTNFFKTGPTSMFLNGSSAYAIVSNSPLFDFNTNTQFSISLWIYPTAGDKVIISKYDTTMFMGYYIKYMSTSNIQFYFENDASGLIQVTTIPQCAINTWSHVAVTYNGNQYANGVNIFINGNPAPLQTNTDTMVSTPGPVTNTKMLCFGALGEGASSWFAGCIDTTKIYDYPISQLDAFFDYTNSNFSSGSGTQMLFKIPGSIGEQADGTSTAWQNISFGNVCDGALTSNEMSPNPFLSHLLIFSNFGFNIPSDANIQGIQAVISGKAQSGGALYDTKVSLMKNGSIVGNNLSNINWTMLIASNYYGGSSNLWGTTWTPAEINSQSFGLVFQVTNTMGAANYRMFIDGMYIEVTYNTAGTSNFYPEYPNAHVYYYLHNNAVGNPVNDAEFYIGCSTGSSTEYRKLNNLGGNFYYTYLSNAYPKGFLVRSAGSAVLEIKQYDIYSFVKDNIYTPLWENTNYMNYESGIWRFKEEYRSGASNLPPITNTKVINLVSEALCDLTVYNENGSLLEGANIGFYPMSGDSKSAFAFSYGITGSDGKALIKNIIPKFDYAIMISKSGYRIYNEYFMDKNYFISGITKPLNVTLVSEGSSKVIISGNIILPSALPDFMQNGARSVVFTPEMSMGNITYSGTMEMNGNYAITVPKDVYFASLVTSYTNLIDNSVFQNQFPLGRVFAAVSHKENFNLSASGRYKCKIYIRITNTYNYDNVCVYNVNINEAEKNKDYYQDRWNPWPLDGKKGVEKWLPSGDQRYFVWPYQNNSFMPKEVTIPVNADNNNIIYLDLDAGSAATVNITVRDSKNNPYSGGFMIYAKNRRYYNTSGSLTSGSGSVSGLLPGDYVLTTRGGLLSSVTHAFLYKEFSFSGTTAIEAVMEPESVITGKYTRNVDFARETLTAMANIHGSSLGGKEGAPICMVKVNGDGTFRLGELNSQFAYDVMLFTWTRGVQSVATAENIRVSGTIDISELLKPAIDVKASQWQMFSVPYVLPGELAEIKSFFKDFAENNIISVYRWDHALATYTSPLRIEPGNSYWVKSSMAMNVLLPDTAQRTPLDRPHSIKLQKGWNMLATPFDFPFETEMVVVKNGDTVKSFREAVTGTDRWLEPEKFMHNGTTGYVETKNVGPWKGFWWYAKADLELSLEPVYAFDTDKSNISPILPYFSPLVNGSYEKSGRDFLMRIKTVSSGAEDREAYIGTADTAEDGLCALDCRKAPVFKDYVSAAFPQGGELLGRDVKSPVTTFKTWQFDVDSDIDSDITVSWEMIRRAPALRYFLLDVQSGTKIEMSEGSTYAYHAYGQANNPSVRTFKAFAATPEYADMIMAEFGIKKTYAYPNPAVNNARIVANMKSINASGVLVKIYDVSGRLLVTAHMKTDNLVDYYYDWNLNDDKGRSTGSGVYIFRITAISYGNDKTEAQIKRIAVVR